MHRGIAVIVGILLGLGISAGVLGLMASAQGTAVIPLNGPYAPGGDVLALAIAPSAPDVLYAAIDDRLYRSDDGAMSWAQLPCPISYVRSLAVDPQDPGIVYAGSFGHLYKSTDAGLTWTEIYTLGRCIVVDSLVPSTIYVADFKSSDTVAVGKSTDGGQTWTTTWAVTVVEKSMAIELAINPVTPTILFLGVNRYDLHSRGGSTIYRSADGGQSWTMVLEMGSWGSVYVIRVSPLQPEVIYATTEHYFYKSTDGGSTWSLLDGPPEHGLTLALDPQHPDTIYAAPVWSYDEVHLYKSFDGGESWWISGYVFPSDVPVLVAHPSQSGVLYAGLYDYGVYRSTNGGSLWEEVNDGIRRPAPISALAVHPRQPEVIYATGRAGRGGVFKTTDGGLTWTTVLTDVSIDDLVVNPLTPTVLYAAGPGRFYSSQDGGQTWNYHYSPVVQGQACLAIDPHDPRTVYLGGSTADWNEPGQQGVIYKRRAYHDDWGWCYWWESHYITGSRTIVDLAVHPFTPTILYAASLESGPYGKSLSILRSEDSGVTWQRVLTDVLIGTPSLTVDPVHPEVLYVSSGNQVLRSTDGGETWTSSTITYEVAPIRVLAVDRFGIVYAGTQRGVYRSTDQGEHWEPLTSALADYWVYALQTTSGDPSYLLIGTYHHGVWKYTIPFTNKAFLPIVICDL